MWQGQTNSHVGRLSCFTLCASLFFCLLCGIASAQLTPSDDAYIDTAKPTTNFGKAVTLGVLSPSQTAYITFDLSTIPSGYTGSSIAKASLKLYVSAVTTAGSFNVDYVNGAWAEATIDANNAPSPGATIAASIPLAKSQAKDYILVDITPAVVQWLNGTQANTGIALVANSPLAAAFESKENVKEGHAPELDIVFAAGGGGGTITGVLTASGSGLQGGGTSGTLNLSLLTTCAANQLLQWNGSGWKCSAAGSGTITGVTAGTDLTGGGSSGTVTLNVDTTKVVTGVVAGTDLTGGGTGGVQTLNLDTTKVPQLNTPNTFNGNQTVNGSLSATGFVTGSAFQIGSNLFGYGSFGNRNAFLGFAGNSSMTGTGNTATGALALSSDTSGGANTASGFNALASNTTGSNNTATGLNALSFNTTGGSNTATGTAALFSNTNGSEDTATGEGALNSNTTGSANTASGYAALLANTIGQANTASGAQALFSNTSGSDNTASGSAALYSNTTGGGNTASGNQALSFNTTGSDNTANGSAALYSNTTGVLNTASGYNALLSNTSGSNNSAYGYATLNKNVDGSYNTAVGYQALLTMTTGTSNTGIGVNTSASNGIVNATAIGAWANVAQSNSLVLGSTATQNQSGNTFVGIDVSAPSHILTVLQGGGHAIADGWDTYSSRRWKKNIHPLPDALAKVEQLRGVSYDLKDSGKHEIGVIAEEVGQVVPEVVSFEANGKDAQGVDYSRLTALLIEAVKQQQQQIRQQQGQIRQQEQQIRLQQGTVRGQQHTITDLRTQVRRQAAKIAVMETGLAKLEQKRGEVTRVAVAHLAP